MTAKQVLDVSQLEPCEPLERVLAAIPSLQVGEYLCMLHRMEPHLLYPILTEKCYSWLTQAGRDVPVEVYIWRSTDKQAEAAVRAETK